MRIVTLAIALAFAGMAHAHEADGPNGGRIVDAGNLHVELVAKGRSVNVFVTDANDKPVAVEGYKGTAVLVIAGKPQRIPLAPAAANRLTGEAPVDVPAAPKGAVQLQLPGGASVQGSFR